jgi:hypothetical protein
MPKKSLSEGELIKLLLDLPDKLRGAAALNEQYDARVLATNIRACIAKAVPFLDHDVRELLAAIAGNRNAAERTKALQSLHSILEAVYSVGAAVGMRQREALRSNEQRRNLHRANIVRRTASQPIDEMITALAGPVLAKHPKWTSHRVAVSIAERLNKALGSSFKADTIRKRVKKYRTVRASSN